MNAFPGPTHRLRQYRLPPDLCRKSPTCMPAIGAAKLHSMSEVASPEPGNTDWARPMVHWEIVARDADAQAAFYRELFNWEVGDGRIRTIPPGLGGPEPGPAGHIRPGREPSIALYVQVRDLRSSLDNAVRL